MADILRSFVPPPLSQKMGSLSEIKQAIMASLPSYQLYASEHNSESTKQILDVFIPSYVTLLKKYSIENPVHPLESALMQKVKDWIPLNEYIYSLYGIPARNTWAIIDALMDLDAAGMREVYYIRMPASAKEWMKRTLRTT